MADNHDIVGGKTVLFADGVERRIRPLSIRQLRKFVVIIEKLGDTSSAGGLTDEDIDTMVEAAQIIFEKIDPELAADKEAIEDAVDLLIFNDMMNVAMGNASPNE
jgi:hypothetical protein